MKVPLDSYDDSLTILQLSHYPRLIETFDFNGRKILASYLVQKIVDNEANITTADDVSLVPSNTECPELLNNLAIKFYSSIFQYLISPPYCILCTG